MRRFDFEVAGCETVWKRSKDRPVYLTIDLDVMDPSIFPGTGTPEPGGVGFLDLHRARSGLRRQRFANVVGCDLTSNSARALDPSGTSTACCLQAHARTLALAAMKIRFAA